MKRTFTRQELYDLVWSTPITTLAERFEISDRGLAKTCARHHVPVPGRGYWAKVGAGQPATKTPLWKIENPNLDPVHIGGAKQAINPYIAFAIEAANAKVEAIKAERQTRPPREKAAAQPPEEGERVVFEPVRRPHASIADLAASLRAARPDEHGEVSAPGIRVHERTRSRVIAILHHLVSALDDRGVAISCEANGVKVAIGPDAVRFEISEERKRHKHDPTPSELKKREEFERRREAARRRGQWLPYESFWPEYDYVYSGKLTLEIQNWADGARKRWNDGKHKSLEALLDTMADGVVYHLAFNKARREDQEEQERRRKHMAHRRALHKQRQERETKRLSFLQQLADDQREAAGLRATIAEASGLLAQADGEYVRMIDWANQRLAYLEVQNRLDVLTANLREHNLFPEPDELHDLEGDPPPPRYSWGD